MPWEVSIKRPVGGTMGSKDEIVAWLSQALPSIEWEVEPAMIERIKDMPDHPFHKLLPTWDESTRAHMSIPHLRGHYTAGPLYIEFFSFEREPIEFIHTNIRGTGNSIPALAVICLPRGWVAEDFCENKQIDLTTADADGWKAFQQYRDDAIQRIRESDGN